MKAEELGGFFEDPISGQIPEQALLTTLPILLNKIKSLLHQTTTIALTALLLLQHLISLMCIIPRSNLFHSNCTAQLADQMHHPLLHFPPLL